ncbi:MAG: hypothetical protein IJF54_06975 [Clostridia bacterium]|nr:hypothetical protein [Clostridia bacterium]
MFGYVKAFKPELKMCEYDTYKAVYCSLCRQLGKDYGPFSKMILSYDFTFLALVKLGLQDECVGYTKMRCPFNPLVKCNRIKNESEQMRFTAACAVILFYHKLLDNIKDNGFFGSIKYRVIYPIFALARNKAKRLYPEIDADVTSMMQQQESLERQSCSNLDEAAEPTAVLLSKIFSFGEKDEITKRVLERLGYTSGKWIYLMDALDDLDSDLKSKNYNPIAVKFGLKSGDNTKDAKEHTKQLINMCDAETASAFELLSLKRYQTIIGNIIYLGMPDVLKNIDHRRKKHERSL